MIPNQVKNKGRRVPTRGVSNQMRTGTGLANHAVATERGNVMLSSRRGNSPSAAKGLGTGPQRTNLGAQLKRTPAGRSFLPNQSPTIVRTGSAGRKFGKLG
jgi:hypothetical protein